MPEAPQGTVTFLFTDIVGSSRLWEKFPHRMGKALARHDELMRTSIRTHGGHVFKTVGDAFCAAFNTPSEALHAAIKAQQELTREEWFEIDALTARMGIHTGTAEYRDGDYFGGALNRCARIEAAAHGGQILLSQVTHELLADDTLDGIEFTPLGTHHLRNLDRPEHLFQVVGKGLREKFPPPRSMEVLPNNLPSQSTSFVGREREMEEVKSRLARTRLLTLTGTGGTGKTRLSLETGAQLIHDFPDGVWLVEFAVITEPDRVMDTVAQTIGARPEVDRPLRETVHRFLHEKHLLLILDNCEHLLAAISTFVLDLLRACPHVKVLATSRHSLGIQGEMTFPVPPLGMLDVRLESLAGPDLAERLSQYEAVKLFIERATAVRPDFAVTNANAPALAEICSRLDGIPLAIELAAARIRVLDLDQIALRLDDRFRLLRSGSKTGGLPHQQTLQALIDWSHDLLSPAERKLFRRLGVFVGGRSLEALEAVCSDEEIEPFEILDLLQELVEKSLVTVERDSAGGTRYTLIESVWHYAREKLDASDEANALHDRHLEYFLRFAEMAAPYLEGPDQKAWLDRCQREFYNFRGAFQWAIGSHQIERGCRLFISLHRVIEVRGNLEDAYANAEKLLGGFDDNVSPLCKADCLTAAARIAWAFDRYPETRQHLAAAFELYEMLQNELGSAFVEALRGFLDRGEGSIESAEQCFLRALSVGEKHRDLRLQAMGLGGLGSIALDRGELAKGRELKERGLAIYESKRDYWVIGLILWGIVEVSIAQNDHHRARSALIEWARITQDLGNRWILPYILEWTAQLALALNQPQRSAMLFGAAQALFEHFGAQFSRVEKSQHDSAINRLQQLLAPDELKTQWDAGRTASPWELLDAI